MGVATDSPTADNASPARGRLLLCGGILAIAAVLAYANSFSVPMLFDDWVTILHNPKLRQLWPLWSALSPPEATGVGGRPIANLSFVLNYAVAGESVRGFHAVNLAIHFLAGLTLFGIVRRTLERLTTWPRLRTRALEVALVSAALWMLHPVQTQSVTYISQRTESLMGLFFFFTLYAFGRGIELQRPWGWFAAAVAGCFAGMATKEGMVTIPLIVLLYDYAFVSGSLLKAWRQRWPLYVSLASSWLLLALLMSGLHGRGVGFGQGMSWWTYLLVECTAIVRYFALTFWPAPLVFDYGVDLGNVGMVEALAALALGIFGIGTLLALWRAPAIGFLAAWFLITLGPTSSVVPIPMQPVSENRIYVPMAAVIVGFVLLMHSVASRRMIALGLAAVAFVVLTAARNRDYRSEVAIWADTVAKRPTSSRAHSNLGQALQASGRLQEARREHETALRLRPHYAEAHVNLAAILGQLGDVDGALAHSRRALEIQPNNAMAFFNLGVGLAQKGQTNDAIAAYEASLRINPNSPEVHNNLAALLLSVGRPAESILHSSTALQLKPTDAMVRYTLGCGLALSGRNEEAIAMFRESIRLNPTHVESRQNLGTMLVQLGRAAEALPVLEEAVKLNPSLPAVLFSLGNAQGALERWPDAIAAYEAALKLNPNLAEVHLNLAIAHGKAGHGPAAVAHLETALRLNPQLELAAQLLAKLKPGEARRSP